MLFVLKELEKCFLGLVPSAGIPCLDVARECNGMSNNECLSEHECMQQTSLALSRTTVLLPEGATISTCDIVEREEKELNLQVRGDVTT